MYLRQTYFLITQSRLILCLILSIFLNLLCVNIYELLWVILQPRGPNRLYVRIIMLESEWFDFIEDTWFISVLRWLSGEKVLEASLFSESEWTPIRNSTTVVCSIIAQRSSRDQKRLLKNLLPLHILTLLISIMQSLKIVNGLSQSSILKR